MVDSIPLWVAIGGFAVPLIGLAGSAVAYVVKLYQDASERRHKRFFELMQYIDGQGSIASKVAAVYALREFTEHREFIERFCSSQAGNVSGPASQLLIDDFKKTQIAIQK